MQVVFCLYTISMKDKLALCAVNYSMTTVSSGHKQEILHNLYKDHRVYYKCVKNK